MLRISWFTDSCVILQTIGIFATQIYSFFVYRQDGLHFLLQGIFPTPGIEPVSIRIGRQILDHCASWEALDISLGTTINTVCIQNKKAKSLHFHRLITCFQFQVCSFWIWGMENPRENQYLTLAGPLAQSAVPTCPPLWVLVSHSLCMSLAPSPFLAPRFLLASVQALLPGSLPSCVPSDLPSLPIRTHTWSCFLRPPADSAPFQGRWVLSGLLWGLRTLHGAPAGYGLSAFTSEHAHG